MKQDRHAGSTELFGKEGRQENLEVDDKNERVMQSYCAKYKSSIIF